jgi:mannose-6-phosphate isomerase
VHEGDVFLVDGGVPHAIGAGCFLIEVQEPTDYTLRVERTTPRGHPVPAPACHQGIGFENMLNCFHYEGYSYENTLARWKKNPKVIRETPGGKEVRLIGREDTSRFRMHRLDVATELVQRQHDTFSIAIVVNGCGRLAWAEQEMNVTASDELFLPAGLDEIRWINGAPSEGELRIVLCMPPEV